MEFNAEDACKVHMWQAATFTADGPDGNPRVVCNAYRELLCTLAAEIAEQRHKENRPFLQHPTCTTIGISSLSDDILHNYERCMDRDAVNAYDRDVQELLAISGPRAPSLHAKVSDSTISSINFEELQTQHAILQRNTVVLRSVKTVHEPAPPGPSRSESANVKNFNGNNEGIPSVFAPPPVNFSTNDVSNRSHGAMNGPSRGGIPTYPQQPRTFVPPPPTANAPQRGPMNSNINHNNQSVFKSSLSNGNNATSGAPQQTGSPFITAADQLVAETAKKNGIAAAAAAKRSLGGRRLGKFVSPIMRKEDEGQSAQGRVSPSDEVQDERLKGLDPKLIELVMNEIMDSGARVEWDDIAGLEHAKKTIMEIVVWPMLRPDIFTGLRGPPKGILLFGPPGTGKTLIGKCIASQSGATFFSISASSLTSKWVGEGEKMVRVLFAVARIHQPSVVFIDEIDSLLSARSNDEHESSRRIKTEFLVQLDGAATGDNDRILVIGATNRPQELDEAARRRLVKRLYIPLPDASARKTIVMLLLSNQCHSLTDTDIDGITELTDGYSGADMSNLCKEAALGPIRSITDIRNVTTDQVRPISFEDFREALTQVRASVSDADLELYLDWNAKFGAIAH